MAVILGILAVIGKILLVILCVLLVLLLLVLFVPFRYEGRIRGNGDTRELHANAGISWLLRFLTLELAFSKTKEDTSCSMTIRLLGISPKEMKEKLRSRKKEKQKEKKKKIIEEIKRTDPVRYEAMKEDARRRRDAKAEANARKAEEAARAQAAKNEEQLRKREKQRLREEKRRRHPFYVRLLAAAVKGARKLKGRVMEMAVRGILVIWNFPGKALAKLGKMLSRLSSICGTIAKWTGFLTDERTQGAIAHGKRTLFRLLRHIRPRELSGEAEFGTGDPALTGEIFGAVSALYPVYGGRLALAPDFTEKRIDGDVRIRGHLIAGVVVWQLLLTVLDRNVLYVIRYFKGRKKEEA